MKILLDTHLLLWAAGDPDRLPAATRMVLEDDGITPVFSAASIWEVAIKRGLGREDFRVEPRLLRRGLLENGYVELGIASEHAAAVMDLPPIHKDPFDRMLIAQAMVSGIELMTADAIVARYPGPVRLV
ncbi:type II toxin-antitoxin system VapC family toxin [Devosia rhizoryzae]|uniref:Type II toxin-antitoxin system VapC family toxin n=1 Tax=Devosia rhizoryzae TaxID=2774137 RepID=A0ABX7C2C4_9HYPH|nr:type II toxin-antitoxin system VapC family toxin [Devosia rhizoryzae]QQR38386.1 type II toxin-antitoxin system VapC family toxin [Devosia rhizoryzae]